jgi:hypothetical protein
MSGAFPGSGLSRYDARVPCFGGGNETARVHYASRWCRGGVAARGASAAAGSDAAHRKMTCRFGLRQRNFHAVHLEGFVEPFQYDAPNALQAQPFACAQLRNRVGD